MFKKALALSSGAALVLMATVVPVMAQTTTDSESPTVDVAVDNFILFDIANTSGDCSTTAGGDCPFGTGGLTSLTPTAAGNDTATYASSDLETTTNSNDGYRITAYAADTGSRTNTMLISGGTGGTAVDEIADSVAAVDNTNPQQAQSALDTTASGAVDGSDTDTGVAFRVLETGTDNWNAEEGASCATTPADCDEDEQWGPDTAKLYASFPLGSGNAELIFDDTAYSSTARSVLVEWFIGVDSTQQVGTYTGTATFTAEVL